jgi:uncharacterized protein (DUF1684 family)
VSVTCDAWRMESSRSLVELWDYRRRVADTYHQVRSTTDPREAWTRWRADRDELFRSHPQSPYPPGDRVIRPDLPCFDYDPAWRLTAAVRPIEGIDIDLAHSGLGSTRFVPFGRVDLESPAGPVTLTLLWLDAYGGGVFLPFRDGTSGRTTYGGGRYLLDTAKGADLGHTPDGKIILDFNFAYHPSCVHDSRWSCPLAPPENRVEIPIRAGERLNPEM